MHALCVFCVYSGYAFMLSIQAIHSCNLFNNASSFIFHEVFLSCFKITIQMFYYIFAIIPIDGMCGGSIIVKGSVMKQTEKQHLKLRRQSKPCLFLNIIPFIGQINNKTNIHDVISRNLHNVKFEGLNNYL